MDLILSIISFLIAAFLLGLALTFGLALFAVLLAIGAIVVAIFMIRFALLKRRIQAAAETSRAHIIEVEYRDISEKTEK